MVMTREEIIKNKADLRGADLCEADLCGADLIGADLRGADLRGAYLSGADLRGANLGGAYLCGAYLRGANLGGAYLCGAYLGNAIGVVKELIGRATRDDGHEFFCWHTTNGVFVIAGCQTHTLKGYYDHTLTYDNPTKTVTTQAILDYFSSLLKLKGIYHNG